MRPRDEAVPYQRKSLGPVGLRKEAASWALMRKVVDATLRGRKGRDSMVVLEGELHGNAHSDRPRARQDGVQMHAERG